MVQYWSKRKDVCIKYEIRITYTPEQCNVNKKCKQNLKLRNVSYSKRWTNVENGEKTPTANSSGLESPPQVNNSEIQII